VNNNDRRLSCKYIQKPCTYYANYVSISLFRDEIHAYSASVRYNSSLPFARLYSPYVTTWSRVTASNFAFTLPYNRLHWPRIGFLCALVKQKLREFHEVCLRKMVWFYHSYSTFYSLLCTETWRGSGSLLLLKFLNVLKNVRSPKVQAGCQRNVEKNCHMEWTAPKYLPLKMYEGC
jgi:hypothetical protein